MGKSNNNKTQYIKTSTIKDSNIILSIQNKTNLTLQKDILGKGGYSTVYHAKNQNGHSFAIKLMQLPSNAKENNKKDFNKIKTYAEQDCFFSSILQHKNIIKTFNTFKLDQFTYAIVMEKASTSLTSVISLFYRNKIINHLIDNDNVPFWGNYMSIDLIFYFFNQMISAVQFMHQSGIAHFDLKPDNFLLFGNDVKLSDFNLSKVINPTENYFEFKRAGTFSFIPPEFYMISNKVLISDVEKIDIFALGCILFKMMYNMNVINHKAGKNKYSAFDIINQINEAIKYISSNIKEKVKVNAKGNQSCYINAMNMVRKMINPDIKQRIKLYDLIDIKETVVNKNNIRKVVNINSGEQIKTIIELQKSTGFFHEKRKKRKKFNVYLLYSS